MRRALRLHPGDERGPVVRIEADIKRPNPSALALSYELTGKTADMRLPPTTTPGRADGLWRHTCFEAFVSLGEERGYLELNLSPSGQWAAYRFSAYRAGMAALEELAAPKIQFAKTDDGLTLTAALDFTALPDLDPAGPWRMGLSAVTEGSGGELAYWALAHPAGRPDFHHPDGFACDIRAPEDA